MLETWDWFSDPPVGAAVRSEVDRIGATRGHSHSDRKGPRRCNTGTGCATGLEYDPDAFTVESADARLAARFNASGS